MKAYKRIAAGLCAAMMCLGMASCGDSTDSSSGGTESNKAPTQNEDEIKLDSEAQEKVDELTSQLEDVELENTTIKFFSHWDMNPQAGQVVPPGLQMFRDKYNGVVEFVETSWAYRYDDLASLVMSNNSPDFFSAGDMDGFPKGAIKGMFQPMDEYIDFSSELYAPVKNVADQFLFNGGHYVAVTRAYPHYVCVYNRTTMEGAGFEDPAELYWNDEWTWSKMVEMVEEFTDASNGKYGFDGWWYPYALNDACGKTMVQLDNGKLISNLEDPQIEKVQNLISELHKKGVGFDRNTNGGSIRGDGTTGNGMGSYETLLYPVGLWGIEDSPEKTAVFGDVEAGEIMFVPMPRLDDSDTYYITSRAEGFHLIKGAPNPEGFAKFMDCQMLAEKEAGEITVNQLKNDYKWSDEMIEMRAECIRLANANPLFDFSEAVSAELQQVLVNQVRNATMFGEDPWSKVREENKTTVDYYIEEANNMVDVDALKEEEAE